MELIIECPHCSEIVQIEQINCGIFRHAVYKYNMEPIPPHSTQQECEELVEKELVWGCGKPFQILDGKAVICGYI